MAAAIRGARLAEIERAGHVSSFERPTAFNDVLARFLGQLGTV
jgi:pimeloyl-ACP methyl ester carboxylesterase